MITLILVSIHSLHISAKSKSSPSTPVIKIEINKSGFLSFQNGKLTHSPLPSISYFSYFDIHRDTFIKRFNYQTEGQFQTGNWVLLSKTKMSKANKGYLLREGDILKVHNKIYKLSESSSLYKKKYTISTTKSPVNTVCTRSNVSLKGVNRHNTSNSNLLLKKESIYNNSADITYHTGLVHRNISNKLVIPKNHSYNQKERKTQMISPSKFATSKPITVKCRYCNVSEDITTTSMIAPCDCEGAQKYIHVNCLKDIVLSKSTCVIKDEYTKYTIKELICENCKSVIPDRLKINNIYYSFIDFIRPESSKYLIFEKIRNNELKEQLEYVVIDMRSKDSIDFKCKVKNHCKIKVDDIGYFYLIALNEDVSVFLQGDIMFIPNLPFVIENNKYIIKFEMKMYKLKQLLCYRNKILSRLSYYDSFGMQKMILYLKDINSIKSIYTNEYEDESERRNNDDIIVLECDEDKIQQKIKRFFVKRNNKCYSAKELRKDTEEKRSSLFKTNRNRNIAFDDDDSEDNKE